jgi:glycerol-3-phosphate acyltransferase PlsY
VSILLVIIGAYGVSSIPFGLVVTRLMGLGDLRQVGSGNIGATNVLRTGNKLAAALTLGFDLGKGAFIVAATSHISGDHHLVAIAAAACVLGHCYPIWLKFSGGKGVATGIGVVLAVNFLAGLMMIIVWLAAAAVTRVSSVAAILAYSTSPVAVYMLAETDSRKTLALATIFIAGVSIWRHRTNIQRLIAGTEPRIGK